MIIIIISVKFVDIYGLYSMFAMTLRLNPIHEVLEMFVEIHSLRA